MSMDDAEQLNISEDGRISLPAIEVLTGRGVIFGKSGSGKSNSASVIVEELLERGFPLLIVDIEGEYYTLKERYEVVHIGATDKADMPLRETAPEQVVDICLDRNRPVIIDLSEVMDMDPAETFVDNVVTILFSREKQARKPFLLIVEEIHEFLPQQGGLDDLGETLIRVAKRGRKRGLGMTGMSQRPAAVDKDFITQCDWLVWHRLTWKNDTQVVKSILGSEKAKEVQELATGEAIMMTDWDEMVRHVQFRRKHTYDAADTPSLAPEDRPDLTNDDVSSTQGAQGSVQVAPGPEETEADADDGSVDDVDDELGAEEAVEAATASEDATEGPDDSTADGRQAEAATANEPPARRQQSTPDRQQQGRGGGGEREITIKSYQPPDAPGQSTGTNGGTPATQADSITDVPKKHADPPFEDGDSRTALWEFGHMVSYVVSAAAQSTARAGRVVVDVAAGRDLEEARAAASGTGTDGGEQPVDPTLSRDQIVLLLSALLLVVILVLAFVVG
ncbi:MAG: ATP-binding protein [Halanaeroarchaeum sp.]